MSPERVAVLGAIAGLTIYLGLPVGRLVSLPSRGKAFLSVMSAGILLFIFWDVLNAAHEILESSLVSARDGAGWMPFVGPEPKPLEMMKRGTDEIREAMLKAGRDAAKLEVSALLLPRGKPLEPIWQPGH